MVISMPGTQQTKRRGTMLLETTVAAVLIGTALVLVARLVGGLAEANDAVERRQWAMHEARNTLERLAAQPWDRLSEPATAEDWSQRASERAADALPGGVVAVAIDPAVDSDGDDPPDGLRLAVEVRWNGAAGTAARPLRLVTWVYRDARGGDR